MALNQFFQHHSIKGKDVYVVDDHHKALAAWALIRRSMERAPNLITIDHHTDTHEAFLSHAFVESQEGRVIDEEAFRLAQAAAIDWHSDDSLDAAIASLRHDEHIDAATCCGALDNAFCIQLSDSGGTQSVEQLAFHKDRQENWRNVPTLPKPQRPMTYEPAANRVYILSHDCFIGCEAMPHNDDCVARQSDEIIEARYLDDQLQRGAEISKFLGLSSLEAAPYILDIDLDAFHSRRAITPGDPTTFYRLIENAVAITIATEADCVEEEWLDEQDQMAAAELLTEMLAHIAKAMAP
jgi:hypothetical protein